MTDQAKDPLHTVKIENKMMRAARLILVIAF